MVYHYFGNMEAILCIEHLLEMCFVLFCFLLHPTQVEEDSRHPKCSVE